MLGALVGDFVGSVYEGRGIKNYDLPLITPKSNITDDSILSLAIADAIVSKKSYSDALHYWARRYPHPYGPYGSSFYKWMSTAHPGPAYNSYGNGSAMRVSAVAYYYQREEDVWEEARKTALPTHNHPEGIKGAQATAMAIYWAKKGYSKVRIKEKVEKRFGYKIPTLSSDYVASYTFDLSCQGSVPASIACYLESESFEDAIRKCLQLGADTDTMACIAGAIAGADPNYSIPENLERKVLSILPRDLLEIYQCFMRAIENETGLGSKSLT